MVLVRMGVASSITAAWAPVGSQSMSPAERNAAAEKDLNIEDSDESLALWSSLGECKVEADKEVGANEVMVVG